MITHEIGVSEMLKEIFCINNDEDLILSDDFETENLEFLKVKDSAYKKMIEYLKNSNSFSFDIFLAINTTLAYGHHPSELDLEIEKYITKYIDNFIEEIGSIKDLNRYLNKESVQNYESVVVNKISYDLIKNIITLSLYHSRLYKDEHIYGVQNLLLNLSKYSHEKFSRWFLTTNRNDLKVIFIDATLNFMGSVDSFSESNIDSEIPFVRAFSKTIFYNIDRNLKLPNMQKYFYDLSSNEENMYFVLYYFSNRVFDLKNQNSLNELNDEIKKASRYLNYLNEDILKEFLRYINISVAYGLVDEIQDNNLKIELFTVCFKNLESKIELEKFVSNHTIEEANILGNILLNVDETNVNDFFKQFNEFVKAMQEPYYVYRFHNQWDKQISILTHYLIAIFIYFSEKKDNKYLEYKDKLIEVKKNFIHTNDNYIEEILKQIV
ncbi:hypothetical protein [Arcobacter sp. FWKO B]|uniref:hypothetical protein n=1 Tax=Arcobacter sp. FWKO B TaxID=2593672 RepID=UPI0018A36C9D|nr:hypothetical protein [Arcobacter sp. FWKO B]QOG13115.1 hypothetical protein FWKOB_10640 [Arcobacter sp. FWKO B]